MKHEDWCMWTVRSPKRHEHHLSGSTFPGPTTSMGGTTPGHTCKGADRQTDRQSEGGREGGERERERERERETETETETETERERGAE